MEAIAKANKWHVVTVDTKECKNRDSVVEWLFGRKNEKTMAFTEGQFTKALKDCSKGEVSKIKGMKLLVLSIEDYNSAVAQKLSMLCDDHRMLFLENHERVELPWDVKLVIECKDGSSQEKHEVAKCGVVFF